MRGAACQCGLFSSLLLFSFLSLTAAVSFDLTELRNKVAKIKVNPRGNLWATGKNLDQKLCGSVMWHRVTCFIHIHAFMYLSLKLYLRVSFTRSQFYLHLNVWTPSRAFHGQEERDGSPPAALHPGRRCAASGGAGGAERARRAFPGVAARRVTRAGRDTRRWL